MVLTHISLPLPRISCGYRGTTVFPVTVQVSITHACDSIAVVQSVSLCVWPVSWARSILQWSYHGSLWMEGGWRCSDVVWAIRRPSTRHGQGAVSLILACFDTQIESCFNAICLSITHTRLSALFPGLPRWVGTRKVKPIWILLKQEAVSGSGITGPYASLHLAPDR